MTTKSSQQDITVEVPEGQTLRAEFKGAGGQLFIDGQEYARNTVGIFVPVNDQGLVQRVVEVGQRLRDDTVVLSVDFDNDKALILPANIFGGKDQFHNQDNLVKWRNTDRLHGHKDWRRVTDDEAKILAVKWAEVTEKPAVMFWMASQVLDWELSSGSMGYACKAGSLKNFRRHANDYLYVPIVRSISLRSLDI